MTALACTDPGGSPVMQLPSSDLDPHYNTYSYFDDCSILTKGVDETLRESLPGTETMIWFLAKRSDGLQLCHVWRLEKNDSRGVNLGWSTTVHGCRSLLIRF